MIFHTPKSEIPISSMFWIVIAWRRSSPRCLVIPILQSRGCIKRRFLEVSQGRGHQTRWSSWSRWIKKHRLPKSLGSWCCWLHLQTKRCYSLFFCFPYKIALCWADWRTIKPACVLYLASILRSVSLSPSPLLVVYLISERVWICIYIYLFMHTYSGIFTRHCAKDCILLFVFVLIDSSCVFLKALEECFVMKFLQTRGTVPCCQEYWGAETQTTMQVPVLCTLRSVHDLFYFEPWGISLLHQ